MEKKQVADEDLRNEVRDAIEELESWPEWTRAGTDIDDLIAEQKRRLAE